MNDANIRTQNHVQLEDEHLSWRLWTIHKKEQKKVTDASRQKNNDTVRVALWCASLYVQWVYDGSHTDTTRLWKELILSSVVVHLKAIYTCSYKKLCDPSSMAGGGGGQVDRTTSPSFYFGYLISLYLSTLSYLNFDKIQENIKFFKIIQSVETTCRSYADIS